MRSSIYDAKKYVISTLLLASLLLTSLPAVSLPTSVAVHAFQPDNLTETARSLPTGSRLQIKGVAIDGKIADLELERFQVFTADAKIVVDDGRVLPVPDHAYYRGSIHGQPENVAVLVIPASGVPEGMILGPQGIWKIGKTALADRLQVSKIEKEELESLKEFRCDADKLSADLRRPDDQGRMASASPAVPVARTNIASYTARVAVETDYEFYALFNDADAAASYVGKLFAYVSSIYIAETATSLEVNYLNLWSGGAGSDPWTVTSGTGNALVQFQNYWNANMSHVERTIVHMLSGKSLGGGIAYLDALCDSSYGYGLSASLSRTTVDTSKTVWDTLVVAHEIGHNFNSPHTQGYCGIGGNSNPVDLCYSGEDDYSGMSSLGLPGIGSLTGGTAGAGNGTIMSYCHLLNGGLDNITMTFGLNHSYGKAADRVPQQMSACVQSTAQSHPGCLDPADFLLTVTRNGTGKGAVTSSPAGISCGSTCKTSFETGQDVTLNAAAAAGSTFTGWSGDCSGTETAAVVTMNSNKTCTATFRALAPPKQPGPPVNLLLLL
jgi:hypothetical protein